MEFSALEVSRWSLLCIWLLLGCHVRQTCQQQFCTAQPYNGTDYQFCTESISRNASQTNCGNLGMRLAVITSRAEFDHWRLYFATNYNLNEVWLGATFDASQNAFVWETGEPVDNYSFGPNPPDTTGLADGTCLRIYIDQWLKPLGCNNNRVYLCQEIPELSTLSPDATTDATTVEASTEISTDLSLSTSPADEICWCVCLRTQIPTDEEELQEFIEEESEKIRKELHVEKETLSATIRKKTSAKDDRPSAQNVGYLGVAMLTLAGMTIIVFDLTYIAKAANTVSAALKSKMA